MTDRELMQQALEALDSDNPEIQLRAAIALRERLAQPEQEPMAFEEWLSKQHGDPEEIGFLQALRIAYISGQDSITTPLQRTWVGAGDLENSNAYLTPPQRKPLTGEEIEAGRRAPWGINLDAFTAGVRFSERAHSIKGEA